MKDFCDKQLQVFCQDLTDWLPKGCVYKGCKEIIGSGLHPETCEVEKNLFAMFSELLSPLATSVAKKYLLSKIGKHQCSR